MNPALYWTCVVTLTALSLLVVYQWMLAVASMVPRRQRARASSTARSRMVVLIPAHNEEAGLAATLRSVERVDYPKASVRVNLMYASTTCQRLSVNSLDVAFHFFSFTYPSAAR